MRSSFFVAAPLLVAVSAQRTTRYGTTLVPEISGSVTVTSTFTYSNPATSLLTQTNSDGVITGLPAGNGGTGLVTAQPPVATIPAGLPKGETTLHYSASKTLESFEISVGPKTTIVLGGNQVGSSASVVAGSSAGVNPNPTGKGSGSGNGKGSGNGGSGSGSSSSSNAAPTQMRAAAGILALGVVAAAFL